MIGKIYRWIWSRIGGRPWTYIMRDFYHDHPLIVLFCTLGIGTLLGHLFWGTPWEKGQKGDK
jgi:hypothetical protein